MRVGKVKLRGGSYWSNKEMCGFKLGCKRYRIREGRLKSDLLDDINIRRHHSPYRGVPALLWIVKD